MENLLSIVSLIVGIGALIQAYRYQRSANEVNKRTKQIQKYIETVLNHSNLINMYMFLSIRDMAKDIKVISTNKNAPLSLKKDTITFSKGIDYSKDNSEKCKQIIFESNLMKYKLNINSVTEFLNNDEQTLKIPLKFELGKEDIEQFMSMSAELLEYDICVLHNIHF